MIAVTVTNAKMSSPSDFSRLIFHCTVDGMTIMLDGSKLDFIKQAKIHDLIISGREFSFTGELKVQDKGVIVVLDSISSDTPRKLSPCSHSFTCCSIHCSGPDSGEYCTSM